MFFTIAGAVLAAIVLNSLWIRIKWTLGFRPKLFDAEQAELTATECATMYVDEYERMNGELSNSRRAEFHKTMIDFNRLVIERYIRNYLLPRCGPCKVPEATSC